MAVKSLYSIMNNIHYTDIKEDQYSIMNMNSKRNRKGYTPEKARQKAMYLADKFENPSGIRFYLKCAWNLNDNYLDWLAEYAFKKADPTKYFISVANKEMIANG